jgi:hypothetical protein
MPEYLSPGVYIEEVDRGPKPIEGVGTAMPAFVGFTEKALIERRIDGELVPDDLRNKPQLITSWGQFVEHYGSFAQGAYLPQAVYGYFNNGGNRCYVISVKTLGRAQAELLGSDGKPRLLVKAKEGGYDGLRLRVKIEAPALPEAKKPGSSPKSQPQKEAAPDGAATESPQSDSPEPEPGDDRLPTFTLIVERQGNNGGGWKEEEKLRGISLERVKDDQGGQKTQLTYETRAPRWVELSLPDPAAPLAACWPRTQDVALTLPPELLIASTSQQFKGEVEDRSGMEGLAALDDVTMLCIPDLMTKPPAKNGQESKLDLAMVKAVQRAMIDHCELMGDRVAIIDAPPDLTPQEVRQWRLNVAGYDSNYAALYYPWIEIDDTLNGRTLKIPPSGHMAGVWARNDNTRGVHKAPANEVVRGAVGLAYDVTKGEQDTLNQDGVNCIRAFPGRGIRVWGARTLSSDPAWRYINVRRLFNYVEKSIERNTQWVVFEPNDHKLWARIRRDVSAFLRTVWQDGMLFGLTPAEAYYVKCDDETNPREQRDLGRLIIEVGLCPVKPAEFVIFRISQWAGPNAEA